MAALERNCREFGVPLFGLGSDDQGIVHVIGPELGLTQPGMTIACGDSHTSTHGAFGAVAFGIGTSQVRDVLASQCLAMDPLKVRRVAMAARSRRACTPRTSSSPSSASSACRAAPASPTSTPGRRRTHDDGRADDAVQHVHRGRRAGGLRQPGRHDGRVSERRRFAPAGDAFDRAAAWWRSLASDPDAATTTRSGSTGEAWARW